MQETDRLLEQLLKKLAPLSQADGPVLAAHTGLALVEGSYALHPELYRYYHTRIFLTCSPAVQRQRLLEREGTAGLARFQARWIPLEEAYFQTFRLPERCDLVLDTGRS